MPAREEILERLKSATKRQNVDRPAKPTLSEITLNREQMIQRFESELSGRTGVLYQAGDKEDALRILLDIITAEGLKSFVASSEKIHGVDIAFLCSKNGLSVTIPKDLADRDSLRNAAFAADAGITSADFAVAETGTLGLIFSHNHPRLLSIAPPLHIAIISVKDLYPVYENVMEIVFKNTKEIPSQFSFITGPSATSDIQGIEFKGMHGPKKVFVIMIMQE
jgi:L-lactate dehydrogenase complex protein LldG